MLKKRLTLIALSTCFVLGLSGCGGGGAKVEAVSTTTTMGQELQDLEAAYQKGIITESEYNSGKKNIMDRYK